MAGHRSIYCPLYRCHNNLNISALTVLNGSSELLPLPLTLQWDTSEGKGQYSSTPWSVVIPERCRAPREDGGRRPNLANLAQEESLHFLQRKLIVLAYESFLSLIDT